MFDNKLLVNCRIKNADDLRGFVRDPVRFPCRVIVNCRKLRYMSLSGFVIMKVFFLDVENDLNTGVRDLFGDAENDAGMDDALKVYRDLIGCDLIDIATRKIDGIEYDLIIDDEGLYSDNAKVSALTSSMKPALVGNVIVTRSTLEGNQAGLSDDDIGHIRDSVAWMQGNDGLYNVLLRVDYI